MNTNIYILNASNSFSKDEKELRSIIRSIVERARRHLSIGDIDIVVKEAEQVEPLKEIDGIGAYCPSPYFVQISIDTAHPSYGLKKKEVIERSLLHELHHAARQKAGVSISDATVLELLFSEGLADFFVEQMTGQPPIWSKALTTKRKDVLIRQLQKVKKKKINDELYKIWFLDGLKKEGIPRWAGYALGLELVKKYIHDHSKENAMTLVAVPVEKVDLF